MQNPPPPPPPGAVVHLVEDEEHEVRARLEYHRDMMVASQQETMWQRIQAELHIASAESFHTALMVCPHLIWIESNPFRYLCCHDGDVRMTAFRMAKYWKNRVELFGQERAFKPLSLLLENSALTEDEVKLIRTGYLCVNPDQVSGRVVVRTELIRRFQLAGICDDPGVRLRSTFYLLQAISERPAAQSSGVCALHMARCPYFRGLDAVSAKGTSLIQYFPIKETQNHFFDGRASEANSLVAEDLMQCLTVFFLRHRGTFHPRTEGLGQWRNELEDLGYVRKELPTEVGGEWDPDASHEEWIRSRQRIDQDRYADYQTVHAGVQMAPQQQPSISSNNSTVSIDATAATSGSRVSHSGDSSLDAKPPATDPTSRLSKQVEQLCEDRDRLMYEHRLLERLIKSAKVLTDNDSLMEKLSEIGSS